MLQIEIDGKALTVEQGSTVMDAAHQAGTYIPHFCYHKKLSIAANCRMCLVEVEKAPKPLPACATPVTDGMKVKTDSPLAKAAQQGVMEFLLINHPLDCPICDQGGECQLQDLAVGYGNSSSRYEEEKRAVTGKDMGPLVSAAEMSRCIHCTRCVRFTEEIAGMQEIGMVYRGEFSEIMPFIGQAVETELSGNVIDLCPVGALTSKPFRYDARSWELSRRKSVSAHDALGANLVVQVKDHAVRRVLPLENEAINECWLADRDRFAYEGLNHAERLQKPQIKHDGQWHETDWETALAYVVKGLKGVSADFGADAIGFLAHPMSTVEELYLAKKIAAGLGIHSLDSRLRQQDFRLDGHVQCAMWLGQTIQEWLDNDAIWVIGANLRQEQPLLTARLRQAAKKGTAVSLLAAQAETLYMPVHVQSVQHPAVWVAQLQSVLAALTAGTNADDEAGRIAQSLKQGEKASVVLGADAQNHPQFAEIYALAQQITEASGARLGILPQAANSVGADVVGFKSQHSGSHAQQMLQQPKKAVLLLNVEPDQDWQGAALAETALRQAQTVIGLTAYRSPALLELADVLLPIAPFTETSGSLINMEGRLQSFHGVVRPLGDARPAWKVLRVLGNLLQLEGFAFNTSEEVLAAAIDLAALSGQLNNRSGWMATSMAGGDDQALMRVGGVAMYNTDSIVRRAAALQQTSHAQIPVARLHPHTLSSLSLAAGTAVMAQQAGSDAVRVVVAADDRLPENVVVLPVHADNKRLGATMAAIEFKRG